MFCVDVELLDLESTSVVLSAAIVHFEMDADSLNANELFDMLVRDTLFIKFNAREQAEMGRTISHDTLNWWKTQSESTRIKSFTPSATDLDAADGLSLIDDYIKSHTEDPNEVFWQRGILDQGCLDSLCRTLGRPCITNYRNWRDVRTAIDLTKETASRGYCKVSGFEEGKVVKHDPVHDVAYDALMLIRGK